MIPFMFHIELFNHLLRIFIIIIIIIIVVVVVVNSFLSFSHQRWLMVPHLSLKDNKSPQVSRTLLGILTNLNNAVVRTVLTCAVISNSLSPCTNPLMTVPRSAITIGIIVTFMFHSLFIPLARSSY